jgi:hypothetical protein
MGLLIVLGWCDSLRRDFVMGMSTHAELSSAASLLDELMTRLNAIGDELTAFERDRLANDLWEVERNLGAARRRLVRLVESSVGP